MAQNTPTVMRQGKIAPWLYLAPAMILLLIFVVYPTLRTFYLSFRDKDGSDWAYETAECQQSDDCWGIFENYHRGLFDDKGQVAIRNTVLWLLVMVPGTVLLGLLFATLADRVRYEAIAKAIIFMPMAVSFVGASIIWKFVYDPDPDIGSLNALLGIFGIKSQAWLAADPPGNTLLLTVIALWVWTGFTMTIIAAALKAIPTEIIEASRVDGANEWQVFYRIMLPQLLPTLAVVATTMTINTLKIFDIIWVMSTNKLQTEVLSTRMVRELYENRNSGLSAALAVILIVLILPVMIYNVRSFTYQERNR